MIPKGRVREADRKEGFYWSLPDGEKQNRCPRVHIKEDPEWWAEMIMAYNAYDKGFLPSTGGIDDQPALFVPIMSVISSALEDERKLESEDREKKKAMVEQSKQQASNAPDRPKFSRLPPAKRG